MDCPLHAVDFKNLYALLPVEDAISMILRLLFDFQTFIVNAHLLIDLLGSVLRNSLKNFDKEYFKKKFGIIMGTNVAPIFSQHLCGYVRKVEKSQVQERP